MTRPGGRVTGVKAPDLLEEPRSSWHQCVQAICRAFPIPLVPSLPSRGCSAATTTFKRALGDSETCGSGSAEESRNFRSCCQGRVEAHQGFVDPYFPLSDP
jgi:hypothetical protein